VGGWVKSDFKSFSRQLCCQPKAKTGVTRKCMAFVEKTEKVLNNICSNEIFVGFKLSQYLVLADSEIFCFGPTIFQELTRERTTTLFSSYLHQ
jgi:hypothetical protein